MKQISNLQDLLQSEYFNSFEADKLGNDLFINDPERADRIYEAAKEGTDGSTHAERIEDMREANDLAERSIYREQFVALGFDVDCAAMLADALKEYISGDINDCEEWHDKNGSLEQVGG